MFLLCSVISRSALYCCSTPETPSKECPSRLHLQEDLAHGAFRARFDRLRQLLERKNTVHERLCFRSRKQLHDLLPCDTRLRRGISAYTNSSHSQAAEKQRCCIKVGNGPRKTANY